MPKCSHIKRSALSRFLLAVTHISGKDHHILPISLLHGMDQGNRICNAAIQIRNTVNLYHGAYNRNTGRSPSNIHQATSVMLLSHIFRITSLAVGHYQLTLRIWLKKSIKIKRKQFIWIFVKQHIHVKKLMLLKSFLSSNIAVCLILYDHAVSGSSRLPGYIIKSIAGTSGNTHHIWEFHLFFHKIIQNPCCKYSPASPALQDQGRLMLHCHSYSRSLSGTYTAGARTFL